MRRCLVLLLVVMSAPAAAATNHHCANEQPLAGSKRIVIAREQTELSDIYVTCWRRTNRHRVMARFPAADNQAVAFRIRGEWVVWRYRTEAPDASGQRDRMGSIDARTGHLGPTVAVPVPPVPLRLTKTRGPVAQDVGDADAMQVYVASNGYYAWPVSGELPDAEGGGQATAMYTAAGRGNDVRIDIGSGPIALRNIRIRGTTLRWDNNGLPKHARLGRVGTGSQPGGRSETASVPPPGVESHAASAVWA
jgi:hypothetical protein